MHLKEDLSKIPHWVWIGVAGAVTLLYFLQRPHAGSAAAAPAALAAAPATDPGIPTAGGSTSSTDYSGTLAQLQSEIAALQTGAGSASGPGPTQQQPTTDYQAHLPNAAYNPVPIPRTGLLPTTSSPTAGGLSLANQYLQQALGVYGGPVVDTNTPYAGLGSTWDGVTQTTYQGGGVVTNLGVAQSAPAPGQVIPPAVQDQTMYDANGQVDWAKTLQNVYIYPQGFQPGQTA